MSGISAQLVKELREKTGAGMMDCKKALVESDGDLDKAVEFLRKKGLDTAKKRAGRATSEGTIQSYIHMGSKLGVMVEVSCETDFVAKNEDFIEFAKNIAMHIAATNPLAIKSEDVSEDVIEKEREISKGRNPAVEAFAGCVYAFMGRQEEAQKMLEGLLERSGRHYVSPYALARLHLALGKSDEGFKWLEKAYEECDHWLCFLKAHFAHEKVSSDTRLAAMLKKIGLDT